MYPLSTREGYTFKGFFTEITGGTKLEMLLAESGIDKDMTFYAQWEQIDGLKMFEDSQNQEFVTEQDKNINAIINNPKTSDSIIIFISILAISVLGIIIIVKARKRKTK